MLKVDLNASKKLPEEVRTLRAARIVEYSIENSMGLQLAHRGFFEEGTEHIKRTVEILLEIDAGNLAGISWSQISLANITASAGRYEESLEWGLKAAENRKKKREQEDALQSDGVIPQNLGRGYFLLGQFDKAREELDKSIEIFESAKNWAMLA